MTDGSKLLSKNRRWYLAAAPWVVALLFVAVEMRRVMGQVAARYPLEFVDSSPEDRQVVAVSNMLPRCGDGLGGSGLQHPYALPLGGDFRVHPVRCPGRVYTEKEGRVPVTSPADVGDSLSRSTKIPYFGPWKRRSRG